MTPWDTMASEVNTLFGSALRRPLTGADMIWISIILKRHGGTTVDATHHLQKDRHQATTTPPATTQETGQQRDAP
jgi:hypothetical protein